MMRTTVSTQPQIIIVACCITLRRSAYDTAGNIRSITKDGTVTKSFGYTNPSWPDLLTSVTANGTTEDVLYEGQSRTSDLPSSGNPVTYYNGRDYHFDWSKGRQLTEAVVGGQTVKYAYDMAGVRSSKQVGDTTYTYTTLSGKVMRQQWGNKSLEFVYDDGNQPFAMIYKHGAAAELYYYLVNAQGDVAAILDSSGTMVASYNYGAWGSCTVYNSSDAAIGDLNPLRYRGYYYDAETGFYYLQSRYYDPAICRFINADGQLSITDFVGSNLFAYCLNNPVNMSDSSGNWPSLGQVIEAVGTVVLAVGFVAAVVASAGAVGIAAGVAAASIGATGAMVSTAITIGTVGTYAVAAGIGACALSNVGEILTGTNIIRDKLMGGNQGAYSAVQNGLAIVGAGAVMIGQMNPGVTGHSAKPSSNAKAVHKVPTFGTPNTSFDKLYSGNAGGFQRVYYDSRGGISLQIDFTCHNNPSIHSNPHLHIWNSNGHGNQINLWYLG